MNMIVPALLLPRCFVLLWLIHAVISYEACSGDAKRSFCPDGNTCCVIFAEGNESRTGCIPNDLGSYNAMCCHDDDDQDYPRGCAVGYQCVENGQCLAGDPIRDPLVQALPRYKLGPSAQVEPALFGLPILKGNNSDYKFVYYSSHGDLTKLNHKNASSSHLQMILIVIHGAGRNADDYFCSSMAAAQQQAYFPPENVLLVAPRFPNLQDNGLEIVNGGTALRWDDGGDTSGPWRYGAPASAPPDIDGGDDSLSSSYRALDLMLEAINASTTRFPLLQKVSIVGHSSGGQLVQRWALMTPRWIESLYFGIVANPSSYAYLIPSRYIDGEWKLPLQTSCSGYNQWEHGLEPGGDYSVPYVQEVMHKSDVDALTNRYRSRRMAYLIGSLDVCPVSGNEPGWCNSHGLETTCADLLQGSTRLERHEHFLESLERLDVPYARYIVPGVHHDHSLMFNSPEGLRAIFGPLFSSTMAKAEV